MNQKLAEVLAALEAKRQAIYQEVTELAQAQIDYRSEPTQWSIGEVLHHLYLTESSITRLVDKLTEKAQAAGLGPDLTPGSMLNSLAEFPVEVGETKREAPSAVRPQARLPKAELLAQLRQSRAELQRAAAAVAAYDLNQLIFPHPRFGPLNLYQWILFIGQHEGRHLSQIKRTKGAAGFPAIGRVSAG